MDADVIVVGAGLAGLVATAELADAGRSVILVDQEPETNFGAQAFWSFGGLFFVDSPEQRRMGIKDSHDLAWQDWLGTAGFDRAEDHWPRAWAEAYVDFAAGEKRAWLHEQGMRWFPDRRLGRAGRLPRDRPRQLRAALPRHLGHRPRGGRPVRTPRAGGGQSRHCDVALPPPCRRPGPLGEVRRSASAGRSWSRARPLAAPRPRARWSGTSSSPRRRSSSRPAESAVTTPWSGRAGRQGSAPRRWR